MHHQACVDALDELRRRGHDLVIAPQVLYEFWSVATRPIAHNGLGMSPAEAHAELLVIQRLFRLLRAVVNLWIGMRPRRKLLPSPRRPGWFGVALTRPKFAFAVTTGTLQCRCAYGCCRLRIQRRAITPATPAANMAPIATSAAPC